MEMQKVSRRLEELEETIYDIRHDQERLEEQLNKKADEYQVRDIVEDFLKDRSYITKHDLIIFTEKLIEEKELMSEKEIKHLIDSTHFKLIKWVVGTGLSVLSIIIYVMRYF
ncbi:MAG: hypothetical protein H0Z33_13515 [Bacillaceae bacterium]|nr:hypothetical protein [Bacillaceae bacterium]